MTSFRRARGEERPRWGSLGLVVLHLLLAFVVPLGDAELEAASLVSPTHVEAPTEEACAHGHDHVFCQLCRALNLTALPGRDAPAGDLFLLASTAGSAPLHERAPGASDVAGLLHARAPPRV